MNKAWIALAIFFIVGGFMIYQQTSEPKGFALRYLGWIGTLFGNVKDVTGHAVQDYTWLPGRNSTNATRGTTHEMERR